MRAKAASRLLGPLDEHTENQNSLLKFINASRSHAFLFNLDNSIQYRNSVRMIGSCGD